MALIAIEPRAVLRRGLLSDPFTNALYSFSPYRGCAHACAYCDGRAEKYYVEGDFGADIQYRANLAERLAAELPRLREVDEEGRRPLLSIGSGISDVYQGAESGFELTRKAAEILSEFGQPAFLITKSSLVLRDIDVWTRLNEKAGFVLVMTVAMADDGLRGIFEPGASPIPERLKALDAFHAAGCATGALGMPLLPGLSDSIPDIRSLIEAVIGAGVDYFMPGGLSLRPGRQKDHFLGVLAAHRPELLPLYGEAYAEERPSGMPKAAHSRALTERIGTARDQAAASTGRKPSFCLPHRILRRIVPAYEALHILFLQMAQHYAERGVDTRPLKAASTRYAEWLRAERIRFNRSRSLDGAWLSRTFRSLIDSERWEALLVNGRLAAFARDIVLGGKEFDA
jgi:DNA repair photolyase